MYHKCTGKDADECLPSFYFTYGSGADTYSGTITKTIPAVYRDSFILNNYNLIVGASYSEGRTISALTAGLDLNNRYSATSTYNASTGVLSISWAVTGSTADIGVRSVAWNFTLIPKPEYGGVSLT